MKEAKDLVRVAKSTLHGRGLFATRSIRRGRRIGEFQGVRTRREGSHVLWVEDESGEYGIRGTNEFRFLNHSKRPNAEFDGLELYALKAIAKGEEVTIDYGEDWD